MRIVIQRQTFHGPNNSFHAGSALILDCQFTEAMMEGANLADAIFVRCRFKDVSLYWANLLTTVFLDCSFTANSPVASSHFLLATPPPT